MAKEVKTRVRVKSQTAKKQQRKNYITVLSVLSAFAVVILHSNSTFWTFTGKEGAWPSANAIESIFYFAVPIFFMISGANLIGYRDRYDTKTFMKKRLSKILIPLIGWSLLALIFLTKLRIIPRGDISPLGLFNGIFNAQYFYVYWFFIPLISLYFIMPVLSAIDKKIRKEVFKYAIIAGVLINSALPFFAQFVGIHWNGEMVFWVAGGYTIFAILGYYIDHYEIPKKIRILLYVMGLAGLITHMVGTYFASINAGEVSLIFKGMANLPSLLYAVAIFTFFKQLDKAPGKIYQFLVKICNWMADSTFGVYLVHMFVMTTVEIVLKPEIWSLQYRLLGGTAIFLVSLVLVKIMKKIPLVRKLVP